MCDCCKKIEPKFRACPVSGFGARIQEVCVGCLERTEGFVKSITVPFPEPPEPASKEPPP